MTSSAKTGCRRNNPALLSYGVRARTREGGDGLDMVGLGSSLSRRRHGDCVVIVGFKAASTHGAAAGERLCDEQPARRGGRYRDKLTNSSGLNDILPSIRLLSLSSNYLAK